MNALSLPCHGMACCEFNWLLQSIHSIHITHAKKMFLLNTSRARCCWCCSWVIWSQCSAYRSEFCIRLSLFIYPLISLQFSHFAFPFLLLLVAISTLHLLSPSRGLLSLYPMHAPPSMPTVYSFLSPTISAWSELHIVHLHDYTIFGTNSTHT